MDNQNELKPFFAKFLESGLTREELSGSKAGQIPPITRKYPSDGDDEEYREMRRENTGPTTRINNS